MHRQTVTVGAQEISYLESEGTGRPVVFVHGNSSSARTWQPQLEGEFGGRFRCLALDLPGHGHSAPAADHANYSLPGYAEVLTGFMGNVGVLDAVVVGWSLGGHIAIEAAPAMTDVAGWAIFGTPPVSDAGQLGIAFLPNPVMNVGFAANVSRDDAAPTLLASPHPDPRFHWTNSSPTSSQPTAQPELDCWPASERAGSPTNSLMWASSLSRSRSCTALASNWSALTT